MDAAGKADDIRLREETLKAKQDYDGAKLGVEIKKHQPEQQILHQPTVLVVFQQ